MADPDDLPPELRDRRATLHPLLTVAMVITALIALAVVIILYRFPWFP